MSTNQQLATLVTYVLMPAYLVGGGLVAYSLGGFLALGFAVLLAPAVWIVLLLLFGFFLGAR